jgi:hypothetical protein
MRPAGRRPGTARAARRGAPALGLLALLGCTEAEPASVVYDLIEGLGSATVERETAVLDVGERASRPFLERGFSWSERDEAGRSFAWSDGEASVARFTLHSPAAPRLVVLRGSPFLSDEGVPPPRVAVLLDGVPLETIALQPGLGTYALAAPRDLAEPGDHRLELRYSTTARPMGERPRREARPEGAGGRRGRAIAVAWDALALLRSAEPAEAEALLDAALRRPARAARASGRARERAIRLAPGEAVTFALDLGPGAVLELDRVRFARAHEAQRLGVWLVDESGTTRWVGELAGGRAGGSAGGTAERFALPLERFGSVRLSIAHLERDVLSCPSDDTADVGTARVLSSPYALPGELPGAAPRAHAAPHR